MITIKELARLAGVSPTTVSNVIHKRTKEISPEKMKRVEAIIENTGYVPNMAGKLLAGRHSQMIGVILSTAYREEGQILQDAYHGGLMGAIEQAIREAGYFMLLHASRDYSETLQLVSAWNIEGLIVLEPKSPDRDAFLKQLNLPVVFIDSESPDKAVKNFYAIGMDDFSGGRQMAEFLLATGHQHLAFLADETELFGVDLARFQGVRSVCPQAKLLTLDFREKNRQAQWREMLASRTIKTFDALFFSSDYFAVEAIKFLSAHGACIPEDLSIAGFDDSLLARFSTPSLTTIQQNISEKGKRAVSLLCAVLAGEKIIENEIILPVKLIKRESVKNRRTKKA